MTQTVSYGVPMYLRRRRGVSDDRVHRAKGRAVGLSGQASAGEGSELFSPPLIPAGIRGIRPESRNSGGIPAESSRNPGILQE